LSIQSLDFAYLTKVISETRYAHNVIITTKPTMSPSVHN